MKIVIVEDCYISFVITYRVYQLLFGLSELFFMILTLKVTSTESQTLFQLIIIEINSIKNCKSHIFYQKRMKDHCMVLSDNSIKTMQKLMYFKTAMSVL